MRYFVSKFARQGFKENILQAHTVDENGQILKIQPVDVCGGIPVAQMERKL